MTIELIINCEDKVTLKEDLILNKLNKHHIVCLEIEQETCNYTIKSVKKIVFCGIKDHQEIFTISHLTSDKYFQFQDILNYSKNRDFVEKQILSKQLKLNSDFIKRADYRNNYILPINTTIKRHSAQTRHIDY